jgi:hypothetical protein
MRLVAADGSDVTISVVGYQFPNLPKMEFDSKWLHVQIDVHLDDLHWSVIDPCLETDDLGRAINWFKGLENGEGNLSSLSFLEPVLQFDEIIAKGSERYLLLTIKTEQTKMSWPGHETLQIEFVISSGMISQILSDLESDHMRYP